MEFLELARRRCSVRAFENRPVEAEKIARILEAGRAAPSACNNQPYRFLVLDNPESIAKLSKACRTFGAPLAIVVAGDNNEAWVRTFDAKDSLDIDASIATDHMMLEAEDLGLGSCWVCSFRIPALREEFGIPGHLTPVNVLAIGYPAGPKKSPSRHGTERRPLSGTVVYNHF